MVFRLPGIIFHQFFPPMVSRLLVRTGISQSWAKLLMKCNMVEWTRFMKCFPEKICRYIILSIYIYTYIIYMYTVHLGNKYVYIYIFFWRDIHLVTQDIIYTHILPIFFTPKRTPSFSPNHAGDCSRQWSRECDWCCLDLFIVPVIFLEFRNRFLGKVFLDLFVLRCFFYRIPWHGK